METFLQRMFASVKNVLSHDVWPFVEGLFQKIALDNLHALAPLAEAALIEAEHDLPVLFSQGVEGFLKVFNSTVAGLLQKAQAAALQVTTTDIITAAHAAVVNAEAKVAAAKP